MMLKVLVIVLGFCLKSLTGVHPLTPKELYVKEGEMVVLQCPHFTECNHTGDAKMIWTNYTNQEMALTNMSSVEQMSVLVHERSLVIFSASVNHQGNYSCSLRNSSSQSWFRLTVYTTQTREIRKRSSYSQICYAQEACTMQCPGENIPIPDITFNSIVWHKEGESLPKKSVYFSVVEQKDHGVYICTRSYLHHGQLYNTSYIMELHVRPKDNEKTAVITSPRDGDVFNVDLGSTVVIDCKAVMYSEFDGVFWLSETVFVETNNSLPVYYNSTQEENGDGIKTTVSLVFRKVSEDDLSKNYTCKLESNSQNPIFVNISLAQNARPSYISLAVSVVCFVLVMTVTVIIYVKFKIPVTLFLRDTVGCHRSTSDGKRYDAFLMYYESDTDAGLNDHDRKSLESILEEVYGYNLCLFDRNVIPGEAVAEAVLDCIEQSRTVVLVPSFPDASPGSGLLNAIHAALVERQTCLVFIKTDTTEVSTSGSLPEVLQVLTEVRHCVTWKGTSSMTPSSTFFKQLRYYLRAPEHATKKSLLPQTIQDVTSE
uniref:Interleukin 18 receptor 1 n=2 Tax=Mastacembelus armatus TaxID=205130 RepID=A0A3Q3M0N1_9TELE